MASIYVVTGASRGLGLEFVRQIAAKGNTVFALARNPEDSEPLQKLVDNKQIFSVKMDTTDSESIKTAVEEISKHATEGIDVLINNAGIGGEKNTNAEIMTEDTLLRIFQTNVVGVSSVTQAFLPLLRKRGQDKVKKIMNISSVLGSIQLSTHYFPTGPTPAYSISKTALNMYVKLLSNRLASENFIVYSSHPGWVRTELGGSSAPVEPEDSISGQLAVLEGLTAKDNGGFFDYQGKPLPW